MFIVSTFAYAYYGETPFSGLWACFLFTTGYVHALVSGSCVCVASFRGIRWHVAHNRCNMLKISESMLRWSLLAIYSVFVCATCGGTLWTLINLNQSFPTFELRKLLKYLCFLLCGLNESRFEHFILLQCSFPEFDAKLNTNPFFLQIGYYNISYIG